MGNGIRKLNHCFSDAGELSRRHDIAIVFTTKANFDEGLGHSFCYIRPDPYPYPPPDPYFKTTTSFSCISGASVSANTWTPLSTSSIDLYMYGSFVDRASSFESSALFASIPLQPVPKGEFSPRKSVGVACSGPVVERGFLSGPIERGFVSGPIDKSPCSGAVEKVYDQLQHTGLPGDEVVMKSDPNKRKLMRNIRKAITKTLSRGRSSNKSMKLDGIGNVTTVSSSTNLSSQLSLNCDDDECFGDEDDESSRRSQNLQWAQGKAGEDRVHIVVSEDNGWVFVGIYDGFNGPDAPDFLLSNLYSAVHKELNGLLWNDKVESEPVSVAETEELDQPELRNSCSEPENHPSTSGISDSKFEWDREKSKHDTNSKQRSCSNHDDVLKALSRALKKTEEAYLDIADRMLVENPELALMGSCVLAMLMKGEDVYLMNVGDSRAVLAQQSDLDVCPKKYTGHDLDGELHTLSSLQLTLDHSTNVKEEVRRIKREHPNDACAVMNDRVKGSLKVTRAFGAGFLKQPKWNDALLEVFRIDYVGNSPYINCNPFLCHHKLGPKDRFLILSSDGLYQHFTNQEAVSKVELFMDSCPEGDPAQHLIEEVLFRAAKEAGMDFHELLEIPQGDRRKFHDDVSIIIISLEGRIWRSSV